MRLYFYKNKYTTFNVLAIRTSAGKTQPMYSHDPRRDIDLRSYRYLHALIVGEAKESRGMIYRDVATLFSSGVTLECRRTRRLGSGTRSP